MLPSFHLPAPCGLGWQSRLFDAAFFCHAGFYSGDKPQLQQKTPKGLQMTQER